MSSESVVTSAIFNALVRWDGSVKVAGSISTTRKAGSVVGEELNNLEPVAEWRKTHPEMWSNREVLIAIDSPAKSAPLNAQKNLPPHCHQTL